MSDKYHVLIGDKSLFSDPEEYVAVAGQRDPHESEKAAARWVADRIVRQRQVLVQGYARGIDREAANHASREGGRVLSFVAAVSGDMLPQQPNGDEMSYLEWYRGIGGRRHMFLYRDSEQWKALKCHTFGQRLYRRSRDYITDSKSGELWIPSLIKEVGASGTRNSLEIALAAGMSVHIFNLMRNAWVRNRYRDTPYEDQISWFEL